MFYVPCLVYLLLSKVFDAFGKTIKWDDINPKECTDSEQLVEGRPEEEIEQVDFPSVLQTLLFNDIHQGSRNL